MNKQVRDVNVRLLPKYNLFHH